jgi:hypothetical protein
MGVFSLRPRISLNLYMSNAQIGSNVSRIYWSLQANETQEQPTWSGYPENNLATLSFSWFNGSYTPYPGGTGRVQFTFDFRPVGNQTAIITQGSFDVAHPSNGDPFWVYGSSDAASNLLGTANATAQTLTSDYNYTPVWSYISIPGSATRGTGYYGEVGATNTGSYGLINGTRVPHGLTFNSNGTITGTPNTVETVGFTFRAYGSVEGSVDESRTITVNPAIPVFSDSILSSPAIKGFPYSDGVLASETSSYSIVSGQLPAGISLNTSTGAVTGTPTTVESRSVTIRATNVTGSADTPSRTIVVNPPAPGFTDSSVSPTATIGVPYSDQVVATEASSYSVFSGSLPDGISLNTSNGVISGTPTVPGTFNFVIRATNVTGSADTGTLTIDLSGIVRVWNGTEFVEDTPKVWNGISFVTGSIRVWNGSSWIGPK